MVKTIVGIRPTGQLHIGHYFSVIEPALKEKADVLIAKYHSSPVALIGSLNLKSELEKYGVESIIQEIDNLIYFELLSASKLGELERMTQYKSSEFKTPHLLIYPVLMAHDLFKYDRVIVGEDQKQHVEYANVLFKRLKIRKPILGDFRGGRIMSLSNPLKKMSKSEPKGCLFLKDSPSDIKNKIKKAVTTPEGILNLSSLLSRLGGKWDSNNNAKSKEELANLIIDKFN